MEALPASEHAAPRRGFTLTEIAIVLGIIGVILGAIWIAASTVYGNLRISKTISQLVRVSQATRALYAMTPTMVDAAGTDETTVFINANVFPGDMINGAATANAWDSTVMVTAQTISQTGDAFGVEYNGVPTAPCISLLSATTGAGRDSGLYYASASAAPKGATAYGAAATGFPVNTTVAAPLCTAAKTVSIQWVFKLKG